MDLLGERERGKAKEIQHRVSQKRVRERQGTISAGAARLVNQLPLRLRSTVPLLTSGLDFSDLFCRFAPRQFSLPFLRAVQIYSIGTP
jgi:hypothetical protein